MKKVYILLRKTFVILYLVVFKNYNNIFEIRGVKQKFEVSYVLLVGILLRLKNEALFILLLQIHLFLFKN